MKIAQLLKIILEDVIYGGDRNFSNTCLWYNNICTTLNYPVRAMYTAY